MSSPGRGCELGKGREGHVGQEAVRKTWGQDWARCNQETERRPVSLEYKGLGRGGCRMLVAQVLDYEIKEFQVLKGSPPSSSGAQ